MPTPTSAVKVNPVTGALIDPPVATFAAANGLLTTGSSDAKNSVRAATTANGTLATAFANGQTVDGIALVTSDRILLKNQTAQAENGIYTVNASGAPTRATDFDAWDEIIGAFVTVESGTVNAGTQWLCNVVAGGTLGTTAITFVVPKNFVDLTTTQTISGAKAFTSTSSTYSGLTIRNSPGFLVDSCYLSIGGTGTNISFFSSFTTTGAIEFVGSYNSTFTLTGTTALTFPTSGTILSSTNIGVSVQAYDADLTTWAGITPGTGVGTGILSRPIFTTTATAAGTTTLTVTSASTQEFTGSTTQTVTMPVVTTLVAGWPTLFINKSTGNVTLNSSGGNAIVVLAGGQSVTLVLKSISVDTTAAAWDVVGLSPLEFTAKLAADQSFAFNVDETVIFQGAVGSLASALNGATGVFTAPKAGTIILSGVVAFTVNGSSEYDYAAFISYSKNAGATVSIGYTDFTASSSNPAMSVPFNFPLSVTAGDTVEIVANLQDNGGGGTFLVKSYSGWTVKYV